MGNTDKTKKQLIEEMEALRLRTAELESLEAERKQAEEELKGQGTKYRAIFESVTDSIVSLDKYGLVNS